MEKYSQFRDKGTQTLLFDHCHAHRLIATCRYGYSALPTCATCSGQRRLDTYLHLSVPLPHTVRHNAFGLLLWSHRVAARWWYHQIRLALGAVGLDWSLVGGLPGGRREARVRYCSTRHIWQDSQRQLRG